MPSEQYQKIKVLGRGAYGAAVLCRRKRDNAQVVIKEIFGGELSEEERRASINEIQVLSMLQHPNIIAYYDCFTADAALYNGYDGSGDDKAAPLMIVMEYADEGTLYDYLKTLNENLSEKEILSMFAQLCLAMHHVHSRHILHRDLKTNNIFVSGRGPSKVLKIADFGISKVMSSDSRAETIVGTPSYLSPELCEGKAYNEKSDVWALGCILYEMVTRRRAFDGSNLPAIIMKIMKGQYEPIPPTYSSELEHLIKQLISLDPTARPDMNTIMSNPYLQDAIIQAQISMGRLSV